MMHMLNVYCIAAIAFGLLMGYVLAWSTRRNEPNGTDVAGLLGTVLGFTIIEFLTRLKCDEGFALYLIGLVVGYVLYLILLKFNWPKVKAGYDRGVLKPAPFFPWIVPCECHAPHNDKTQTPPPPPAQPSHAPVDQHNCCSCKSAPRFLRHQPEDYDIGVLEPKDEKLLADLPKGIDVSRHQNLIDWTKVAADGNSFVFIKATEGGDWVDVNYRSNLIGARSAGLLTGAYHFFRPRTAVQLQIDNFCRTVGSLKSGDLPPVLDIEVPEEWDSIPVPQRLEMVLTWLKGVEMRLGAKPIVYLSPSFARDVMKHDSRLAPYPLWIAHYTNAASPRVPAPWSTWKFWQYSETGVVPGIVGNVDLNRFAGTPEQLRAMARRIAAEDAQ